jgi:two-component system chemotaxis response regulator CheB
MSRKIRVIVVDDSALVRSLLSEIINRQRDMECIGTANDPLVAREMIRELNPDVITLDVEMPRNWARSTSWPSPAWGWPTA